MAAGFTTQCGGGKVLTPAEVETVHRRMTRAIYFIELVKNDITSTKYDVRWASRFASNDPRKVSLKSAARFTGRCVGSLPRSCATLISKLNSNWSWRGAYPRMSFRLITNPKRVFRFILSRIFVCFASETICVC